MRPALLVRQRGVTLLELLLALALGALLLSAVMPMLNGVLAAAALPANTDQPELERQAQFALARIAMAVRDTAPVTLQNPLLGPDPTTSGRWLAPSTFKQSGTTLVELRDGDSVAHVLADSVKAFSIVALPVTDGRQLVQVDLTLARGAVSATPTASVTARTVMRMGWLQ